ncbi:MAG: HIT domain-containing protein [Candidatus Eisenbacteria bacterium]
MEILTTPWRMDYIQQARDEQGCIFCNLLARQASDAELYVLRRGEHAFLVLNIFPYTPGHLLAVPYHHAAHISDLSPAQLAEVLAFCQIGERLLRRTMGCRSIHTGANLGRAAGAGVPEHVHFHVVAWPEQELWKRWESAAELPEALEQTYRRLAEALTELEAPPGAPRQST